MQDVADALYTYLLEEFPADRSYTAADLDQAPMPVAVAHFIKQTLGRRYLLEIGNWRDMRSAWFDYEAAEVAEAVEQTETLLQAYARVPAKTWASTLEEAVARVLGHLVEPAHTLSDFVFHDLREALPLPVILERMHYFYAYPYLARATQAYAEHKQLTEYRHREFRSLILSWDQRITADYKPHRWLRMLEPLFDFVTTLPALRSEGLPLVILQRFFESKGADEIVEQLAQEAQKGSLALDEIALRRVLESAEGKLPDVLAVISAEPEEPGPNASTAESSAAESSAAEPSAAEPSAAEPSAAEPSAAETPAAPTPTGPMPLWMRFQQERRGGPHGDGDRQEPETPKPATETVEPDSKGPDSKGPDSKGPDPTALDPTAYSAASEEPRHRVPLWQRFRTNGKADPAPATPHEAPTSATPASRKVAPNTPAATPPATESADVMVADQPDAASATGANPARRLDTLETDVLGASQNRTRFVGDLFGGSEAAYTATLQRLHDATSWKQATEIIATDVFKKHQVDIYSGTAIAFTNAAQQRFHAK